MFPRCSEIPQAPPGELGRKQALCPFYRWEVRDPGRNSRLGPGARKWPKSACLQQSDPSSPLPTIYSKDGREEKRVPAEFFPLKLIFNKCVFSVPTMTVFRGQSPRSGGNSPVPCTAAVCFCAEHTWVCGKYNYTAVCLFI